MRYYRICIYAIFFCFSCGINSFATGKYSDIKVLADSLGKVVGKVEFLPLFNQCLELAKERNDTVQMSNVYCTRVRHYYNLADMDSLRQATYEYLEWADHRQHFSEERYRIWREYIQRLTEKGMQKESMSETELLSKDAEKRNDKYGLASGEMCVGYNHRVFGNNVKLCLEYYDSALKYFEDGSYFRDAYVVYLNIIQTLLARQECKEAILYLDRLEQLKKRAEVSGGDYGHLHMRYYQFRAICMLATRGKKAAEPYMRDTEKYYNEHQDIISKESWLAYQIMCNQTIGDWRGAVVVLDSLLDYHRSMGNCYPANYMQKAMLLERLGDYEAACKEYANYAHLNDSIRTVELDEQLNKYTAQFEVDRLKMEKLEITNMMNRDRLMMALVAGSLVLILLLLVTYLYLRTLSMNKKLEVAHMQVQKMSRIKSSFIQHVTHELRTPLNSVVGFSTLLAEGGLDTGEVREYANQVDANSTYLLGLMENIIDIADLDSQTTDLPKRAIEINDCCRECAEVARETLKSGVELQLVLAPGSPVVKGVRLWMKRVLLALLENANKFTEKGVIHLVCEEDKNCRIVRFIIEDTGIGIDSQYKDSIFNRFFKIDNFTQGTGLGLAIAYQIMEIVGGKIYLDTSHTGGSRFVVEWPVE